MCMLCDKFVILHMFVEEKGATELMLNGLPYSTVNKSSMSMSMCTMWRLYMTYVNC